MNRRKLFSFLALAPMASVAVAKEAMTAPAEASPYPLGHMIDFIEMETRISSGMHMHSFIPNSPHTHSFISHPSTYETVVHRKKVWNGKQFVDFDSPAGTAVMNAALSKPR